MPADAPPKPQPVPLKVKAPLIKPWAYALLGALGMLTAVVVIRKL